MGVVRLSPITRNAPARAGFLGDPPPGRAAAMFAGSDAHPLVAGALAIDARAIAADDLGRELAPVPVTPAFQTFDPPGAAAKVRDLALDSRVAIPGAIDQRLAP